LTHYLCLRQQVEGFEEFMALIEIPNAYDSDTAVGAAGRGRSAVIGEPVVAVDLINTVATPGSPVADDLLSADRGAEAWWRIERARVPDVDLPDIRALRWLLGLAGRDRGAGRRSPGPAGGVSDLNFFMQSAPASTRLQLTGTGLRTDAVALRVRRESAAGVHRRAGGSVPVRPVEGRPASPVRHPGDFGEVRHPDGVASAWPLSYDDMEPYYVRAEHLFWVHGQHGEDPFAGASSRDYKYPPVQHEPHIQQLSDHLERLGLHPFHLPLGVRLTQDPHGRPTTDSRSSTCTARPTTWTTSTWWTAASCPRSVP